MPWSLAFINLGGCCIEHDGKLVSVTCKGLQDRPQLSGEDNGDYIEVVLHSERRGRIATAPQTIFDNILRQYFCQGHGVRSVK